MEGNQQQQTVVTAVVQAPNIQQQQTAVTAVVQSPNPNDDPTSKYFIHHSDNPSGSLTNIPLQRSNYIPWSLDVQTSLSVKNKLEFVDGSIKAPAATASDYGSWLRCNNLVLAWLRHSVVPEISDSLLYVTSALDFWTELRQRYSEATGPRVLHLKKILGSLSQGSLPITTYFTRFKTVWDEYTNYRPFPTCSCKAMNNCTCEILLKLTTQRQNDMVIRFLVGLYESFTHLRSQFLLQQPLPTMATVYSLLLQEERQREIVPCPPSMLDNAAMVVQGASSSVAPNALETLAANVTRPPQYRSSGGSSLQRNRPFCTHCKKSGHNIDKCYQIHGFPPGYKGKPRLYNSSPGVNQVTGMKDVNETSFAFTKDQVARLLALISADKPSPNASVHMAGIGFGLCLLFIIGSWFFWVLQKRKLKKLKEDFFRQHGGLFLQEQISADEIKTFRIFTSLEIEKATNKFNKQRVLGRGGNGIVYKGYLDDGTTVAIKKSLIVEAKKSKEFAKEMLILSNVNHVNVVKLLGCCLEVEVPMLVYEYVPNGTLSEQIHSSREEHPMPWDLRLKIGAESAKALSYLHSEASPPILHGDIKSSNILLGDNFVPKVSDFGSSTFTRTSKSRLMTLIQGTYGYLDPEYLRYGKLTDKSDVYSFGVVMAELLTRKKAIYIDEYVEKSLASEFECCMREGRLEEILDPQIIKGDNGGASDNSTMKELKEVANLVMQCLNYTGEERPTITQVYVVLERLRRLQMHPRMQQNMEEVESLFTASYFNTYEYQSPTSQLISTAEIEIANIGWINNQVDSSLQVKTL